MLTFMRAIFVSIVVSLSLQAFAKEYEAQENGIVDFAAMVFLPPVLVLIPQNPVQQPAPAVRRPFVLSLETRNRPFNLQERLNQGLTNVGQLGTILEEDEYSDSESDSE